MSIEFKATKRVVQGTGASRRLRRTGRTPGIIYGGNAAPLNVELDHNNLFHALKKEAFHSSVLNLDVDGTVETVVLRDVQYHAFKLLVLHVDFQRVDATHKTHVKVPLHFVNGDIAPGVKLGGGIVSHVQTELDVSALPADLPTFIEVDLKDLEAGGTIHASQITLPAGVELVVHRGEDPIIAAIPHARGGAAEGTEETPAE